MGADSSFMRSSSHASTASKGTAGWSWRAAIVRAAATSTVSEHALVDPLTNFTIRLPSTGTSSHRLDIVQQTVESLRDGTGKTGIGVFAGSNRLFEVDFGEPVTVTHVNFLPLDYAVSFYAWFTSMNSEYVWASNVTTADVIEGDSAFVEMAKLPAAMVSSASRERWHTHVFDKPITARYLRFGGSYVGVGELDFGCGGVARSEVQQSALVECREFATCRVHLDS